MHSSNRGVSCIPAQECTCARRDFMKASSDICLLPSASRVRSQSSVRSHAWVFDKHACTIPWKSAARFRRALALLLTIRLSPQAPTLGFLGVSDACSQLVQGCVILMHVVDVCVCVCVCVRARQVELFIVPSYRKSREHGRFPHRNRRAASTPGARIHDSRRVGASAARDPASR